MSKWKNAIAVLSIFVLGALFGLAISFWIGPASARYGPMARGVLIHRLNSRLAVELSLDAEQEQKISIIIEDTKKQLIEIRQEARINVRHALNNARTQIRAQLKPDQKVRFDDIAKRNRKLFNGALDSK
jgi:Spy/CpxP family protein refolding chaperone